MLDVDTKRRIDTARDILVGKVPDPKSQVEQITIALIYKFMDDLDAESEELGGERNFFSGDFARYGWAKLMHSSLGGYETLSLYAEAITRMTENPGIPLLFREIFNNAYLPYRDPETLRAFLKVIDEFSYDHSERLGDAFEYLLSVLGAQGDAGQFRTPRHIIDFIVAVVDPKKDDTVLDPACGTAGFLISAYKHILAANTDGNGQSTLTPDERGRLVNNFKGYDISPDMVRLSLVNMYLHGFREPHIHEYDTLTSEERWNEYADVILANPPFMSPRGGIQPHNRFSVQSKRSEVLFVDYMAEHLSPEGRAGIIVPEGIIFQSQGAYKQLRKMLVEDYLVAVVSLPAGFFNPYPGVKTSVLILDRALAKRTDSIAFFKVENDGFDLGAQRRPIDRNDLPRVQAELGEYLRRLREGQSLDDFQPVFGIVVEKGKIAEDGEYNLGPDRYRQAKDLTSRFPIGFLKDVAEIVAGQSPPGNSYNETGEGIPFYQGKTEFREKFLGKPVKWTTEPHKFAEPDDILMSVRAPVGPINLTTERVCIGRGLAAIQPYRDRLLTEYAFYVLRNMESEITGSTGAAFASINKGEIGKLKIPLPPLSIQQEIVAEIEGYQKVIDGAQAVVENYRPHFAVDPEWPTVALGEVCSLGGSITKDVNLALPYFGADSIESNSGNLLKEETAGAQGVNGPVYEFSGERLLYSKIRPYLNKLAVVDLKGYCSSDMYPLLPDQSKIHIAYLTTYMLSDEFNDGIRYHYERASIPKINRSQLFKVAIPVPPLETQQSIVTEIQAEQALVDANRELIKRFEGKIQAAVARVWGSEFPTPQLGS